MNNFASQTVKPTFFQKLFSRPLEPKPVFQIVDVSHSVARAGNPIQLSFSPSRGDVLAFTDPNNPNNPISRYYRVVAVVHYPNEPKRPTGVLVKILADDSNIWNWIQSINPNTNNL